MKKSEYKHILVRCFRILSAPTRARLRFHLEKKTPVLSGVAAHIYTDGKGGA